MANTKVEMSLDDIIKSNRKGKQQKPGQKGKGKPGVKNGAIRKGNGAFKGNKEKVTPATKKLVQQLVQKALAQRKTARPAQKTVVIRKVNNPRSRIIKKRQQPRTETVVVRRVQQRPVQQRVIREVIVEQPARRIVRPAQQPRVVYKQSRPKVVYVQQAVPQRRIFKQRRTADPFYEPPNYLQRI